MLSFTLSGLTTLHPSKRAIALTQSFLANSLPVQKVTRASGKGKSTYFPFPISKVLSGKSLS